MSRASRQRRRRRRKSKATPVLAFVGLGLCCIALAAAGVVGYVVELAASAPRLEDLRPVDQGQSSAVFAGDGTLLGFIQDDVLRTPISSKDIPHTVKDATVAIEDRRFWRHQGVDFEGVVRAAVKNITSGKTVEGGSTLTMQLVRTLYITKERTFKRKLHEAKLAEELENVHDKKWILNKYVNNAPYGTVGGQTAVGIQAASRVFFDKPAKDLKLHEAALLAGLPQAPTAYNPLYEEGRAKRRRNEVLDAMADLRMIARATAERAKRRPLGVRRSSFYTARRESYFFDYVRQELIDRYGPTAVRRGGLRVHTTIDLDMQAQARKAIASVLTFPNPPKSAIVTVDPRSGRILTMASSASYADSKFNLAAQGNRQPGSTFKVMGLMAALKRGVSPTATTYTSKPLDFVDPRYGQIKTKTYDNTYGGRMDLVRATLTSDNTVYMQLALDLGPPAVKEAARAMGITSRLDGYPAEVLGGLRNGVSPLELANAYATIASGGMRSRVTAIRKVVKADGTVDRSWGRTRRARAFSDGVTAEATRILARNMQAGTGTSAQIGCPAAGKTGTTDDHVDAWFAGYTPNLATAVWVGYPERQVMMYPPVTPISVAGGTYPAQIWGRFMREVRRGCRSFPPPKTPFVSAPFFGRYATTGAPGPSGTPTATGADSTGEGGAQDDGGAVRDDGGAVPSDDGDAASGGGAVFDPDLYETPPQSPP